MAKVIIENKDLYKERIEYFKEARENMYDELKSLGIVVYPSHANFLWMELNSKIVENCLKNYKI